MPFHSRIKTFSLFNGKPFKTFCSSSDAEKKGCLDKIEGVLGGT
jgi:hypothetical protein